MSREVRLYEPANRFGEAYPTVPETNAAAHGHMHTPQEQLTKTAQGEYGGNNVNGNDEDDDDLKSIKKLLKKRPELRGKLAAHLNGNGKESMTSSEQREYEALMREREQLYAELGMAPPEMHDALYHAQMNRLAEVFVGTLPEKDTVPKEQRDRRKAGIATFGLGRRKMRERGLLPWRSGWI
jgi:hypothetical protein